MEQAIPTNFDKYWYTDITELYNLKDMLANSAKRYPNNAAFWVKEKRGAAYEAVSYRLLQHDVNALGSKLLQMGLQGQRIAVMGQGCYEWICTYLAVMNSGSVVVPIDKELTGAEIGNLLRTSEATTIFCTEKECSKLRGIGEIENLVVMQFYGDRTDIDSAPVPYELDYIKYGDLLRDGEERAVNVYDWRTLLAQGEQILAEGSTEYEEIEIDETAMSVILFTSGTMGTPKGVMLSHRNIMTNIMDVCRVAYILPTDKTLSILPIHHTYECTLGMLLVLYRGASTAFCEGMKYISQNMKEAQNTVLIVVPRVLEMVDDRIQKGIQSSGQEELFGRIMGVNHGLKRLGIDMSRVMFSKVRNELGGKLRIVITGAAALSPAIYRRFEDLGITVLQGYGMTECTPLISGTPMSAKKERYRKAGSVGCPVKHGEIKIVNPDEDGIGEVWFRGPNVMLGYYNLPEETAKVLEPDGWLHTGDLGFQDKDGWLYLTGRSKNIIVTKTGENVYPEELEELINANPDIVESMVFPYKLDGEEIVGVQIYPDINHIEEAYGKALSEEELDTLFKDYIRDFNQSLPVFKRIRAVFVRNEDFVRTTTLKIKRNANPAPVKGSME